MDWTCARLHSPQIHGQQVTRRSSRSARNLWGWEAFRKNWMFSAKFVGQSADTITWPVSLPKAWPSTFAALQVFVHHVHAFEDSCNQAFDYFAVVPRAKSARNYT